LKSDQIRTDFTKWHPNTTNQILFCAIFSFNFDQLEFEHSYNSVYEAINIEGENHVPIIEFSPWYVLNYDSLSSSEGENHVPEL
jgi:hypothetical protein